MSSVEATASAARPSQKTVLVTGATGYLGSAVCRAFARAGWSVHGLVRRAEAADALLAEEVTPVIGAIAADLGFLDALLAAPSTQPFDVVVSCTEQFPFDEHWAHVTALLVRVAHHARRVGAPRPLVLVSSGCKDYGQTARRGAPGLAPHAETSPLSPPDIVRGRALGALGALEHPDLFDAAVLRPTPLFGYGGSYYGVLFEALGRLRGGGGGGGGGPGALPGHPDNICHGCHVDDCAEAYLALAAHPSRADVAGRCFNVSGRRYETVAEILAALGAEYGFEGCLSAAEGAEAGGLRGLEAVLGYSQWVDSTKIRRLTGWTDKRRLFSEDVRVYRLAYEAAARAGDTGVARIRDRVAGWVASGLSS
ncbi:NAD(P)-binding protein [Xylaria palmicola]|nr:NAD(P)-binding protein [Xylaria palmicola]